MALRVDGIASVPLLAHPDGAAPSQPPLLDADGTRADGRGPEEFRHTSEFCDSGSVNFVSVACRLCVSRGKKGTCAGARSARSEPRRR